MTSQKNILSVLLTLLSIQFSHVEQITADSLRGQLIEWQKSIQDPILEPAYH